jgi:hypothetical protein
MEFNGGYIMKKVITIVIALALICVATQGFAGGTYRRQVALCASITDKHPSNWVLQQLGNSFFEQEGIRNVSTQPLVVRSVFTKGEDSRIYLVSRWYDFDPTKTYTFDCQWIDPDGKAYTMRSASLQTPDNLDPGIYFTYTTYLNMASDFEEGQWTVKLFLNGEMMETQNLTIE